MLNNKQRNNLKAVANGLDAIYQIGKGGINDNLLTAVSDALDKNEIVKISVLKNSGMTAEEALEFMAQKLNAESVFSVGAKFVLYRRSEKENVKHIDIDSEKSEEEKTEAAKPVSAKTKASYESGDEKPRYNKEKNYGAAKPRYNSAKPRYNREGGGSDGTPRPRYERSGDGSARPARPRYNDRNADGTAKPRYERNSGGTAKPRNDRGSGGAAKPRYNDRGNNFKRGGKGRDTE